MIDSFEEDLIRKNAIFFAKGKMPEIVRHNIPDSSYDKKKTYIVSIVEVPDGDKIEDKTLEEDDE